MVDTYEVDGNPLNSFERNYDSYVMTYYIEYVVTKDIVVKATFIKPHKVTVTTEPSGTSSYGTATVYTYYKGTKDETGSFVRPNSEIEISVSPYWNYKLMRVTAEQKGKEVTLPIEKKEVVSEYGYTDTYVYSPYTTTEEDNRIHAYVIHNDSKMYSVSVEGISPEAAQAGAAEEINPEVFEGGKYPENIVAKAFVTQPKGYKLVALTANEGITLNKVEGAELVYSFKVTGEVVLTAKFEKETKEYSVAVADIAPEAAQAGCSVTITPESTSRKYTEGTIITATCVETPKYKLANLKANDDTQLKTENGLVYTFAIKSDVVLTAKYQVAMHSAKVAKINEEAAKAECSVTLTPKPNADGKYEYGTTVTATITLGKGYKLEDLKLEPAGETSLSKKGELVQTFDIHSDVVLTAKFQKEIEKYSIKVAEIAPEAAKAGCSISLFPNPDAEGKYPSESNIAITVNTGKDYELESLKVSDNSELRRIAENTYTFILKGDVVITATFKKKNAVEVVTSESIQLYPNPATTQATLQGLEAGCLVRLFSSEGVEVLRSNADEAGQATLQLEGIASGNYLVKCNNVVLRLLVVK